MTAVMRLVLYLQFHKRKILRWDSDCEKVATQLSVQLLHGLNPAHVTF